MESSKGLLSILVISKHIPPLMAHVHSFRLQGETPVFLIKRTISSNECLLVLSLLYVAQDPFSREHFRQAWAYLLELNHKVVSDRHGQRPISNVILGYVKLTIKTFHRIRF